MPFSTLDNLISNLTSSEKYFRYVFDRRYPLPEGVVGVWFDTNSFEGTPVSNNFYTGTDLAWTPCDESKGIPHGGNVSPDTKHILNASVVSLSINAGASSNGILTGYLTLVDLQGYWPGIQANNASIQNLTGTPGSNLRYTNGAGCRLYLCGSPNGGRTTIPDKNITISYTNQNGTTGKTFPSTVKTGYNNYVGGRIINSGAEINNFGPFLPLANEDNGVANVASIQFSVADTILSSDRINLCLARPLLTIPIFDRGFVCEKDFLNEFPSLPRVRDGACLVWLYGAMSASGQFNSINGSIDFGWG